MGLSERFADTRAHKCYFAWVCAFAPRLPSIYPDPAYARAGGLMSYATSVLAMAHRAATFVDKILNGATPADLPVEQAMTFRFLINLKTAKALGITIPAHLLTLVDEVIP
jgi:putative ABC transport system substrate-binding protein